MAYRNRMLSTDKDKLEPAERRKTLELMSITNNSKTVNDK